MWDGIRDAGCGIRDVRCEMSDLDFRFWILDFGFWSLDYRVLVAITRSIPERSFHEFEDIHPLDSNTSRTVCNCPCPSSMSIVPPGFNTCLDSLLSLR
jgi:hypothetical protein